MAPPPKDDERSFTNWLSTGEALGLSIRNQMVLRDGGPKRRDEASELLEIVADETEEDLSLFSVVSSSNIGIKPRRRATTTAADKDSTDLSPRRAFSQSHTSKKASRSKASDAQGKGVRKDRTFLRYLRLPFGFGREDTSICHVVHAGRQGTASQIAAVRREIEAWRANDGASQHGAAVREGYSTSQGSTSSVSNASSKHSKCYPLSMGASIGSSRNPNSTRRHRRPNSVEVQAMAELEDGSQRIVCSAPVTPAKKQATQSGHSHSMPFRSASSFSTGALWKRVLGLDSKVLSHSTSNSAKFSASETGTTPAQDSAQTSWSSSAVLRSGQQYLRGVDEECILISEKGL